MVDHTVSLLLSRWGTMQPQLAVLGTTGLQQHQGSQQNDSWLKGSILWNTPTHRRTVEKRTTRKFGAKNWGVVKGPQINKRIRVDNKTGEYFELGKLAPQTYKKVMEETRRIQKRMADTFGVGVPKDEEVLVVYKGEGSSVTSSMRVVEMEHERPAFFSQNLLQKEHGKQTGPQQTVKPSGLG
eukprot:GFUD01028008.1.p1 GENE.GFUD01028008.1~~GFUD01028008.1.p1  ORF type:complete len:203 (+),score=72.45 GFUD01028008.1:63-611(+)